MALWAGSYLRTASGPETGHVDIGGTHIPASVSTVSTLTKYPPSTHTHTAGHFYPPLRDGERRQSGGRVGGVGGCC